jgi:hypothetical protein
MTEENWKELEILLAMDEIKMTCLQKDNMGNLMAMTANEAEHPEWYESWCDCRYCNECGA